MFGFINPLFHISSPIEGWRRPKPARHHDHIDPRDFPIAWKHRMRTVEVEAKAEELARLKRLADLKWLGLTKFL